MGKFFKRRKSKKHTERVDGHSRDVTQDVNHTRSKREKRGGKTKKTKSRKLVSNNTVVSKQQSTDFISSRVMTLASVFGIVGGLIGLYLLLGTNITDSYFETKLKQNTIYAKEYIQDEQDGVDDYTDDESNGMDQEDNDESDISDNSSTLDDFFVIRPTEILIDRKELIDHLDDMNDDEFNLFIRTMVDVINEHTPDEDEDISLSSIPSDTHIDLVTLQEAYERAEREFPGQIDGSRRIQLINELNAIDYDYYVVEHGDTLGHLSQALEVPMGQFMETNGIHDADEINIGEILLVPVEE